MSSVSPDDCIANPGDKDLDCHLIDLRISSFTSISGDDFDLEGSIVFDCSEAKGWCLDPETGEQFSPGAADILSLTFGIKVFNQRLSYLIRELTEILVSWQQDKVLISWTAAPGKWNLLKAPGHRRNEVVIPRGEDYDRNE